MKLKEQIQNDFVVAMKAKDQVTKNALSSLKSKITESEKLNSNQELTEEGILKVISNCIKQRKQSYDEFIKGNRLDLSENEKNEMLVLEKYMPKSLTKEEMEIEIKKILDSLSDEPNINKKIGKTIGLFNKSFPGMSDANTVKEIINSFS